jgi:phage baseplate assembly protein W
MVSIPHFKIPLQLDPVTGRFAVVEQDTEEDVQQCVVALLRTEVGDRLELSEYGIPSTVFEETIDQGGIMAAIERWEPRATTSLTERPNPEDDLQRLINVTMGLKEA